MAAWKTFSSQSITLILLSLSVGKISCFCEQSYVVICDSLRDFKKNDTTTWRHVVIGNSEYKHEPPTNVLDWSIMFNFIQTKSFTVINQISSVRSPLIPSLDHNKLEYLNLYDNEIKYIEDETFSDVPRLREVYLDNNKIEYLGRSIFQNTLLEMVSLQYNQIQSITTAFYGSKIEWIRLNNNKIDFIKREAFPNNLEQLELNHNLLETIPGRTFQNLRNLKSLSIENNRLKTFPLILHLTSLQFLHLSYNNIERILDNVGSNDKFSYLDLSSNNIYELDANVFSPCFNCTAAIVIISFNRLTNLQFSNPESKTDLVLYGNPWVCDCLNKIEKTLKDYHHDRTCEMDCFKKGQKPVCIENGKCGEKEVNEEDLQNFISQVNTIDYQTRRSCNVYYT